LSDQGPVSADIDDLAAEWRRSHTVPAVPATQGEVLPLTSGTIDRVVLRDLAAWSERHAALLREFGRDLLGFLSERDDASRPVPISQLAKRLADERTGLVRNLTQRELAALIADAHNRGFTPGLVKTPAGYAIAESHFSFKQTQHHDAKSTIARVAAEMVTSGQRVGLDGGTTTLPIAEALVARLESEQLDSLTVLTNSLPVVERFARFVEERGWSDSEAAVRVLVCAGLLRPNTQALAEVFDTRSDCLGSLTTLVEAIGGLDWTFVGANGITATEGITMPTAFELPSKLALLDSATHPYVVADPSKFGQRLPHRIAGWDADLTLLTCAPQRPIPEFEAVLMMPRVVRVQVAGLDR
jgi:DeoR/GlpR family transcriptional regulator of sugar metabolism